MFPPSSHTLSSAQLARYELDRVVVAEVFPNMRYRILARGAGALATGVVDVDVGAGCWETVDLRLEFDLSYPTQPPRVFDRRRRWVPDLDRHLLANHQFCLWLAFVDMPDVTTPEGLRDFLLRLIPFLRDQFVFDDRGGSWPGAEWAHGPTAAYAQHLIEHLHINDITAFKALWPVVRGARALRADRRCPCGSARVYGDCHRDAIEQLAWVRNLAQRDALPAKIAERLQDAA